MCVQPLDELCMHFQICVHSCVRFTKKNKKKKLNRSALFWHNLISSAQSGPAWHSRGPPEHIPHLCAPITASQLQQHERQPLTTSYFIKPSFYHGNKLVPQTKRSPAAHRQWTGVLARVHITHFLVKICLLCLFENNGSHYLCVFSLCLHYNSIYSPTSI